MKIKQLESALEDVEPFSSPVVKWEQYPTGAHLASHMLFTIENSYGDISGKTVLDLGCGCGMLTIGASLLESSYVVGVDIDAAALEIAYTNCEEFEVLSADFILADVTQPTFCLRKEKRVFDTVIMNPPFGTKIKGVDMVFLQAALQVAPVVYSLHKTSTRAHILAKAEQFGAHAEVLAQLRWNLPPTLKFHKKQAMDIEVDFFRFETKE